MRQVIKRVPHHACPDLADLGIRALPAAERPLHVVIVIFLRCIDEHRVVRVIVPLVEVRAELLTCSAHDDAAVCARDEVGEGVIPGAFNVGVV